jgi:hypothetical protein
MFVTNLSTYYALLTDAGQQEAQINHLMKFNQTILRLFTSKKKRRRR